MPIKGYLSKEAGKMAGGCTAKISTYRIFLEGQKKYEEGMKQRS